MIKKIGVLVQIYSVEPHYDDFFQDLLYLLQMETMSQYYNYSPSKKCTLSAEHTARVQEHYSCVK